MPLRFPPGRGKGKSASLRCIILSIVLLVLLYYIRAVQRVVNGDWSRRPADTQLDHFHTVQIPSSQDFKPVQPPPPAVKRNTDLDNYGHQLKHDALEHNQNHDHLEHNQNHDYLDHNHNQSDGHNQQSVLDEHRPDRNGHEVQHQLALSAPDEAKVIHRNDEALHTCIPGACPMCGSTARSPFANEKGYTLHRCTGCGFLYLYPMAQRESTDTFEERWYDPKVAAYKKKVEDFWDSEQLHQIKLWLDVGAGNGELLSAVQMASRSTNITGLETSEFKIKNAAKKGLKVIKRDLSTISERFDVISTMNVLSHVACPVAFYHMLAAMLNDNGCLFMCTGNAADLTRPQDNPSGDWSLPDHVVFAGKKHVALMMERAGLEVKSLREYPHFWHNYRPFRPGPFRAIYVKACRPSPGTVAKVWVETGNVLNTLASAKDSKEDTIAEPETEKELPVEEMDTRALIIKEEPPEGSDTANICPICGEKDYSVYLKENSYTLAQCSRCKFLYVNPMPFGIDADAKTYKEHWEDPKVKAMEKKVSEFFTNTELKNIRQWLDVGAGNGELLMALRQVAPHINASGIETTAHKIKTAKTHGLFVRQRPLDAFQTGSFDIVTVMNVLSHVPRPIAFYKAISRLVADGGCIWTSTGNAADVQPKDNPGKMDLPDHLAFAGKRHIYTIFHRIGFKVVQYQEFKHFWHNYRALKPGPFRAVYVRGCKPANKSS